MRKTLRTFSLASVLLTGVAATGFAATPETPADRSQGVTGTHQTMPGTPTGSMNSTAGINSTDQEVQRRDLVKGYEFSKNRYALLSDEDFDSVKVESSSVMAIEKFVPVNSIDPIYYASSYYLAPDGDAGRDVYAVLCRAIAETGRVALARVVIGQRERTIAVRSMPGGLVAHTLDEQRDINDAKSILGDAAEAKTEVQFAMLCGPQIANIWYQLRSDRPQLRDDLPCVI
jgi:non-homologous end joining protein Ku